MRARSLLLGSVLIGAGCGQCLAESQRLMVGDFSHQHLEGWERKAFKGETRYQLQNLDGQTVLAAESRNAASGLFKTQTIDLQKTPVLHWRWRIANRLPSSLNEQDKSGDDYAARVYVIVKGGLAFWQTKTISYVWSARSAPGTRWANAFAGDHAMMLALRGPEAPIHQWQEESRNIVADWQMLFGEPITALDAIAIMTDTDNSGASAQSYYGDLWLSE